MYSVVLATMMTVSASGTAWNCHGCHGCSGYAFTSCIGCCGCYGGCYGCWGSYAYYGCSGCYGCYGGCYGCWGCYGPVVVYRAPVYVAPVYTYYSPYVIVASSSGSQSGATAQTEIAQLRAEVAMLKQQLGGPQAKAGVVLASTSSSSQPAVAKVTVHLPADAKLYIDDVYCSLTSDTRSFTTPKLDPSRKYYYMVKAEAVRDGGTVSETQRVIIEPGREASVTFGTLTAAPAPRP